MKRFVFFISILLISHTAIGQATPKQLSGDYCSVNNKSERWSILSLKENQTFKYNYGLGGCQAIVTGKWTIKKNQLFLINDPQFNPVNHLGNDSLKKMPRPFYPDLSKTNWIVKTNWIKPIEIIDCGCLKENGKHKKIKNAL